MQLPKSSMSFGEGFFWQSPRALPLGKLQVSEGLSLRSWVKTRFTVCQEMAIGSMNTFPRLMVFSFLSGLIACNSSVKQQYNKDCGSTASTFNLQLYSIQLHPSAFFFFFCQEKNWIARISAPWVPVHLPSNFIQKTDGSVCEKGLVGTSVWGP